ncbi:unnamed protein product [Bursaphelenchus xylophilus]|uniref:(pine wood nematode) hypothetical protein n=1 Tax=Bursaphelenchus xylophilus TaxID=6326 RepID=A0A1I7SS18_BURXY|nr:unnamed protein product [Bursaphelenchus xylophilus]CAG9105791.1 unnamed protein product [Bursaphelenchus xylophilus]
MSEFYSVCQQSVHVHQAAYILALFFCILWTLFVLPITLFCIIKFDLLLAFLGVLVGLPSWLLLIGNRRKTTWCYWPFMVINLLHLIFSVLFAFSIPLIALTETVAPLPKRQASYREPVFDSARTFPLFVYIVFELIFILLCYISYHVFMIVLYSYRYVEDYHHIIRRHKRKQSRISSKTVV